MAFVGGMNYWASDYLNTASPVNDVSMQVRGPAAHQVSQFDDILWRHVCANRNRAANGIGVVFVNLDRCLGNDLPILPEVSTGIVRDPIMVVGKLGVGIGIPNEPVRQATEFTRPPVNGNEGCFKPSEKAVGKPAGDVVNDNDNAGREYEYRNPGEDALRALILSAKASIFISQQDLLSCLPKRGTLVTDVKFDERLFAALAIKILDGVHVRIVLSAGKGGASDGYGNGWSLNDVAAVLKEMVAKELQARLHGLSNPFASADARAAICKEVGLAHIRSIPAASWPNGKDFANHAKLVAVDNQAFYIGSENLYPSHLQELGFIVEDPSAADHLLREYLAPLWANSRPDALIDPDPPQPKCGSF